MSTKEQALLSVSSNFPKLNLGNVNVNLQNAMAALTLGLPFSQVHTPDLSHLPSAKLTF